MKNINKMSYSRNENFVLENNNSEAQSFNLLLDRVINPSIDQNFSMINDSNRKNKSFENNFSDENVNFFYIDYDRIHRTMLIFLPIILILLMSAFLFYLFLYKKILKLFKCITKTKFESDDKFYYEDFRY